MTNIQQPVSQYDLPMWDRISEEICCPMCGYNLRGLAEPRCPECGYTFEWRDLLDPDRQNTECSFENLAPPTIRTFWKTAIKGLTPRKFWTLLRPNYPAVPYRLFFYWLEGATSIIGATIVDRTAGYLDEVAAYNANLKANVGVRWRIFPHRPRVDYADQSLADAIIIVWPWLTLLVLFMLWQTMGRAKVRRIHLVRTIIYCSDIAMWVSFGLIILNVCRIIAIEFFDAMHRFKSPADIIWLLAWIMFCYKLKVALDCYLKFKHSLAIVIISQLIVVLFLIDLARVLKAL